MIENLAEHNIDFDDIGRYKETLNLPGEKWLPIERYKNYLISNLGRIKLLSKNKILSTSVSRRGYLKINLDNHEDKRTTGYVNNLVARAFSLPNPNNFERVVHKNGNKKDNRLANLQWNSFSLYTKNESYFENIDTERKAYFLGFLFADGNNNVRHERARYIQWNITPEDSYILEEFSLDIYGDRKHVKIFSAPRTVKFPDNEKSYQNKGAKYINVCSQRLSKDLEKHGCVPRKSLVLSFPQTVPDGLIHHFVRGFLDGDGCISALKKPHRNTKLFVVAFASSANFLFELQTLLRKKLNTGGHISEKKNIFNLHYGGNRQVEKLCSWIYKDATIYLHRKYNLFVELKEQRSKVY